MRILGVCGSLQARSSNLELLHTAASVTPPAVELVLFDGIRDLPHFNPDTEVDGAPLAVVAWRQAIAASEAVMVASPEYGHSLPGSLKNAIDWVIGSGELERKVVAVTASVRWPGRGKLGLDALCNTLRAVNARIVGGESIVVGSSFEADIAALVRALVAEVGKPP
jgi:chromate reductase